MTRAAVLVPFVLFCLASQVMAEPAAPSCDTFTTSELRTECFTRFIAFTLHAQRLEAEASGYLEAVKPVTVFVVFAIGLAVGRSVA